MKSTFNVFGAILAASGLMLALAVGATGQLFSFNGSVDQMPAYANVGGGQDNDPGYIDPLTYDERGQVLDIARFADVGLAEETAPAGKPRPQCNPQTFRYDMNDLRLWKRGTKMEPTRSSLLSDIDKILSVCSPLLKNMPPLRCEPGCTAETSKVLKGSLFVDMESANYASGAMQYVFIANGACQRIVTCH
jgi:hypothetical protein